MQPAEHRPVRVAVLNDFPVVVAGLTALLAPYRDRVDVVDQSVDRRVDPDVDLMLYDTLGAGEHPADEIRTILRQRPARMVVFSWSTDPRLVQEALEAGAAAFLPKTLPPAALVSRLEQIHQGAELTPAMSGGAGRKVHAGWPGAEYGLSPRESEIAALIVRGLSNQEIAERAYLSINSVKTYIRTAYRKMGVSTRPHAVLWLVRHGFDPDS